MSVRKCYLGLMIDSLIAMLYINRSCIYIYINAKNNKSGSGVLKLAVLKRY